MCLGGVCFWRLWSRMLSLRSQRCSKIWQLINMEDIIHHMMIIRSNKVNLFFMEGALTHCTFFQSNPKLKMLDRRKSGLLFNSPALGPHPRTELGVGKGPLFYSRPITKLFPLKFLSSDLSLIHVLDIGSWRSISLISPSSGEKTFVEVITIDAHHCPGKSPLS